MRTEQKEYRIATNEAVMRALGISQLAHLAERVDLVMLPNELPMLTIRAYVEETPPECHLPPLGGFDLDAACREALERVHEHIRWCAAAARVETKNAFQDARSSLYQRWVDGAGTDKEYCKVISELFSEVKS